MNLIISLVNYISADHEKQMYIEEYSPVDIVGNIVDKLYDLEQNFKNSITDYSWIDSKVAVKKFLDISTSLYNRDLLDAESDISEAVPFLWIDNPYIFNYSIYTQEFDPYEDRDKKIVEFLYHKEFPYGDIKDYLMKAVQSYNNAKNKDDDKVCCLVLPINFIDRENPMCIINSNDIL